MKAPSRTLLLCLLFAFAGRSLSDRIPGCIVSNGLIALFNIPSSVYCIGRSDVPFYAMLFGGPAPNPLVFGALTNVTSNLRITFYSDIQCQVQIPNTAVMCSFFPPTTCFIDSESYLHVADINPIVKCVKRGDLLSESGTNIDNGDLVFPTPTTNSCDDELQLTFFSDYFCTKIVKLNKDVFCHCMSPPTPTHISFGPSCVVANGLVQVSGINTRLVECIGRSDIVSKFINPPSSFIYGALAQRPSVVLTLYSSSSCTSSSAFATVPCKNLPPTSCTINPNLSVTVHHIEPPVRCVRRGDTGDVAIVHAPTSFTFLNPTTICPGSVQINLFSDIECMDIVKTQHDIQCRCP